METKIDLLIESILEDESLTDGLTDDDAEKLINWCIKSLEKFQTTEEIEKNFSIIRKKGQIIAKAVSCIQDDKNFEKAKSYLSKIFDENQLNTMFSMLNLEDANESILQNILKSV